MGYLIYTTNKRYSLMAVLVLSVMTLVSCNKMNSAKLQSSSNSASASALQQKVLFIVVDGAVGTEVKAIAPPVLTGLTNHAIYSWEALNSYIYDSVTNASGWASLLTGVGSAKNKVTKDLSNGNYSSYPTIFTRLKSLNPTLRTSAFSSSSEIKTYLAGDATISGSYNQDDAATNTAAISEIKSNSPDLVLVQFHGVDVAGSAGSYSASNAVYKAAVLATDAYIGQLISAVQARTNYPNENWLFVIVSNKGSNTVLANGGTWSAFDDSRHNTFSFYYNPRFSPKATAKPTGLLPYIGTGYNFITGISSDSVHSAIANLPYSNTMFGTTSEYTIQCKIKVPTGNYYYPNFLGFKQWVNQSGYPTGVGFAFNINNLWLTGTSGSNKSSINITDNSWHTLTAVRRKEGALFNVYGYIDGVKNIGPLNATTLNGNTTAPFLIGNLGVNNNGTSYSPSSMNVTDIRIYNAALSDSYIQSNYCSVEVGSSDTYYNNLVGFWKALEVKQNPLTQKFYFENSSPINKDTLFLRDPNATQNLLSFNEITTKVCPPISVVAYTSVPNNVDALQLVYSWFKVNINTSWGLDGKVWVPAYNDIIN